MSSQGKSLEPSAPTVVGSGKESQDIVELLTKVLGLLAALAALVYVLGGGLMLLRLVRADAPVLSSIAGQLPREVLVSTALTALLPPAIIAGMCAVILVLVGVLVKAYESQHGGTRNGTPEGVEATEEGLAPEAAIKEARITEESEETHEDASRPSELATSGPLIPPRRVSAPEPEEPAPPATIQSQPTDDAGFVPWLLGFFVLVLIAIALTSIGGMPLLTSRYSELRSDHGVIQSYFLAFWGTFGWWLIGFFVQLVVITLVTVGAWLLLKDRRESLWSARAVVLLSLLAGAVVVPASMLFSAGLGFPEAKICPTSGATPEVGLLIGETSDRVYLLERRDEARPRVASFALDAVGEWFAGSEARSAECDSVSATPSSNLSPPTP